MNNSTLGFVADERDGAWHDAVKVPSLDSLSTGGIATVHSVSCGARGFCVATGQYLELSTGDFRAYLAEERNGAWGSARMVPNTGQEVSGQTAAAIPVSCAGAGNCAVGGFYTGRSQLAFVADESTVTRTSLSLSRARIRFGHEQAERLSVTVTGRTGGTPGGKVTVTTGKAAVCVVTLSHGTGSCTLPARKLRPGTYHLTARYGGSQVYDGSAAPRKTLTVTK